MLVFKSCRKVCSKTAGALVVSKFGDEDKTPELVIETLRFESTVAKVGIHSVAEQIRLLRK